MKVIWSDMKSFIDTRGVSPHVLIHTDSYHIIATDGFFKVECELDRFPSDTTDLLDFENNYQASANARLKEKATTHNQRAKAATISGTSTIILVMPTGGRLIKSGKGWFESFHADDYAKITILAPNDAEVDWYYDKDAIADNQGSYFKVGSIDIAAITDPSFLPAGFKIKIEAITGDTRVDTFRCNILMGKR